MSGKTMYVISLNLFIDFILFFPQVKKQWEIEDAIVVRTWYFPVHTFLGESLI